MPSMLPLLPRVGILTAAEIASRPQRQRRWCVYRWLSRLSAWLRLWFSKIRATRLLSPRLWRVGRGRQKADGQEGVWIWRWNQGGDHKFRLAPSQGIDEGALPVASGARLQSSRWYFIDLDFRDKSPNQVVWFRRRLKKRIHFHIKQQKWSVLSIPGGYFSAFSLDVCIKTDIYSFVQNSMHRFPYCLCADGSLSMAPQTYKKVYMKADHSSEGIKMSQWPLNLIWAPWVSSDKGQNLPARMF